MTRLFVASAVAGVLLAPAQAHAQFAGRGDYYRPAYVGDAGQPYFETRRAAYDNGYREGLKKGENDGRKRARFAFQNERTWQRGDKGYHRSFGDVERYRQSFRAGYESGYADGYRRYAAYDDYRYGSGRAIPRYPGYPSQLPGRAQYPGRYGYPGQYSYSPAYANGLNDGYEKGREDARDRDSYDPLRHKWYRSGDHDYKGQYGSREQYRDIYRHGFKEGYDRGYREGNFR
jgi:flagellar biosynthesis/type III secretory pathway protein FliH